MLLARSRNITSCQVCPGCINGVQELINAGTVLHLELVLHLVNDHFQAVCGIPVTAQELVRIRNRDFLPVLESPVLYASAYRSPPS